MQKVDPVDGSKTLMFPAGVNQSIRDVTLNWFYVMKVKKGDGDESKGLAGTKQSLIFTNTPDLHGCFCLVTRGQSNFSSLIRVSPWHTALFLMVAHEHTLDVFGGTALADSWLFSSPLLPPPLRSHAIFFSFFWLPANKAASLNSPVIPSLYFLRSASAALTRRLAVADLCAPLAHILLASRWLVKGCDNLRKRPQDLSISGPVYFTPGWRVAGEDCWNPSEHTF